VHGEIMKTKLTLWLDDALVRQAKEYSRKSGKSVSRMVADYLALLGKPVEAREEDLTPEVRSLLGALAESAPSEEDYRQHLERKHA